MRDEKQLTTMIVPFYLGEHPDTESRMIYDIWAWDFNKLEYIHNYIQWLFPISEKSSFNPNAPTLNNEVIQKFYTDTRLQKNLLQSLNVLLRFYRLQGNINKHGLYVVTKGEDYPNRMKQWINFSNHNYLRITRILKCLVLLGCTSYAQAFYQSLKQIYDEESQLIGNKTFQFWTDAITSRI